jgi:ribosomal protein S18 acetylase RimI-like enzyme
VPVGFALVTLVNDEAHLDEVDVLPNYGQQGIGTELVSAVANWARSRAHSSLTLITFKHLPWNAPFYEKLGFVRLRTAELSVGLAELIEEEGKAGIDVSKRIGMRLTLREDVKGL